MAVDLESMSLTEIMRLRELISDVLVRRFERNLALVFTDVVGSTAYFAEYGDEAGRSLMQRHTDILSQVLPRYDGRIVDTAGDGAFSCFPTAERAANALIEVMHLIVEQNGHRTPQHQLSVRAGIHFGPVLTDGQIVSGDSVNLCARITGTGAGGDIRVTKSAFLELVSEQRTRCNTLPPALLKGIPKPVEMMSMRWLMHAMPTTILVQESGELIPLPQKPVASFGRLRENNGVPANDVVLTPQNPEHQLFISRWHFELRQLLGGLQLTSVTEQTTEVDGVLVAKGQSAPVRVGTVVRLAGVMTLVFQAEEAHKPASDADRRTHMLMVPPIDPRLLGG